MATAAAEKKGGRGEVDELDILKLISVLNRDNGLSFTDTTRLQVIAKTLEGTPYVKLNDEGLFHMYGKVPLESISGRVLLLSTHVDCEAGISKCYTDVSEDGGLRGTFDNMLTNAAALTLMLRGELPDSVIVAFTGDEEEDSVGAIQASRFLSNNMIDFSVIVLDVTDEGYGVADFTVEKACWKKSTGKAVIAAAKSLGDRWRFVPEELSDIPKFVPVDKIIYTEAASDESDAYDEKDIKCFSLCTPTKGDMHSNVGVTTTVSVFRAYVKALAVIVNACCSPV